jgi:predicted metal-dependent hydrolase
MSKKSPKIAALIERCRGHDLPAHYLGYFECFNQQMFYEAHDVLEELWLTERLGPNYAFYKGLIQFAGAFVHLQKGRLRPAAALFNLSRSYLEKYPAQHERLDVKHVCELATTWVALLEQDSFAVNPLDRSPAPKLALA